MKELIEKAISNNEKIGFTDLMELTLNSFDFRGFDLKNPLFESSDLQGANLSGCDLADATFNKAKLINANLSGSNLDKASFVHADLFGCDFTETNIDNCNFAFAKGNGKQVKSCFVIPDYPIVYTDKKIFVGAIGISIEEYKDGYFDSVVLKLKQNKKPDKDGIAYAESVNKFCKDHSGFIFNLIENFGVE